MRFFIYSRKSVYTGKGESVENQIEMCRQYIFTKFPNATHEICLFEDEGFSAKNTARPKFQHMLRELKSSPPDFLVCYRLDRISRNVSDFSALIEDLNARNIAFVCIKEEFDTSKPMGKAMMYIASVFAQLERETIAERVRDNMLMLARTGRWLGGTTPTGYTSEKVQEIILDGKVKTACQLRELHEELRVVDMIFAAFLKLRSVSGVYKQLLRQNIRSRNGRPFSLPGLKDILQNPVYCAADEKALAHFTACGADVCFTEQECNGLYGLLAYNKRDYRQKRAARQPIDKWIIAIGRHKGRIPGEKWVAVQRILQESIPTGDSPSKTHNEYALLSGLIFCQSCGGRLFAKRRSSAPDAPFDYICQSKLRGGAAICGCRNLHGARTDDAVYRCLLRELHESPLPIRRLDRLLRALSAHEADTPTDTQAQLVKCDAELDRLVFILSQQTLDAALLTRVNLRVHTLSEERDMLAARLQATQNDAPASTERAAQLVRFADSLSDLHTCLGALFIPEKRTLVRSVLSKITWDGERLALFPSNKVQPDETPNSPATRNVAL